jgi:hypothetical protein
MNPIAIGSVSRRDCVNHPVPPGRVRLACLSRHFVPGYLHLVPTGHRRFVFSRLGRARLPKDRRFYQGLG